MKFKRKTNEEYCKEIKDKTNDTIISLEEYVSSKTPIFHKCNVCGEEWKATPESILAGRRCPQCTKKEISLKKTKTHKVYSEQVKEIWGDKIIIIDKYVNDSTKIKHKCNVCGEEWYVKPNDILNKHGCPQCAAKTRRETLSSAHKLANINSFNRSKNNFLNKLKIVLNDCVEPLEEYKGSTTKIKVRCKECGRIWETKPNYLLTGNGCVCSKKSKGEKKILGFLRSRNIEPEIEKEFDELVGVGGRNLRFDFFIKEKNVLIEYQGKQHYKSVDRFGGEKALEISKIHDELKRQFCIEHNIKEIEIPYTEYKNIESILTEELKLSSR